MYGVKKKSKLKDRKIFVFLKKSRKFYMGSSVAGIVLKLKEDEYKISYPGLIRTAREAEMSSDGIYENSKYMICVTDQFIKGGKRYGGFTYGSRDVMPII